MEYRSALITGASSGIGEALSIFLAKQGIEVALASRRKDQLDEIARRINDEGGSAHVYPMDVTDALETQKTIQQADQDLGGIDVVIANAGVAFPKWSGKLTWDMCEPTIAVNVAGTVATLTALLPQMLERKKGHLVGISSLAQHCGLPRFAVYSASKSFVSTFLESLRVDLKTTGIAVTDIRPGYIDTPMNAENKNLPFILDVDEAVKKIWSGISKKNSVVEFPWQLAASLHAVSMLPTPLYHKMAKYL